MDPRRQRGSSAMEDDDFQPKFEWKEEPEANIIRVHLPGFSREQIKVTYVQRSRSMRVSGERLLKGTNRRLQFNQLFHVPQNCAVDKIRGTFRNDILTITMPKETVTAAKSPEQPKSVAETAEGSQVRRESDMGTGPKELEGSKRAGDDKRTTQSSQEPQKPPARVEEKVREGPPPPPGKRDGEVAPREIQRLPGAERKTDQKVPAASLHPKKPGEETIPPPGGARTDEPTRQAKAAEGPVHRKKQGEELSTPAVDPKGKTVSDPRLPDRMKLVEKGKETTNMAMERARGFMAVAAETVRKLRTGETSEEKQLMVNMGVAVLVLAAVGAYVSYNLGYSSGKSKE